MLNFYRHFSGLLPTDFVKENYDKASCTKKGLTEYGFKKELVKHLKPKEIK